MSKYLNVALRLGEPDYACVSWFFSLMIILIINQYRILTFKLEGQTPIAVYSHRSWILLWRKDFIMVIL